MENQTLLVIFTWLHQMATIAWIGGMIVNMFILMPSMGKALDPPTIGKLMGVMMKRYKIMVYSSLIVLFLTGFSIAGLSSDYGDYFQFGQSPNIYFLVKHLLVLIVIILAVVAFEVVAPKAAKLASQGPSPQLAKIQKTQKLLIMLGFVFALVIVLLSDMMALGMGA